jgi:hypothetical protein
MMTNAVPAGAQTSLLAQAHQLAVPNSMGGNTAMFEVPIKGGYVPIMHVPMIMRPRHKMKKTKKSGGGSSRKSRKGGKSKKSRKSSKSRKSRR